MRVEDLKNKKLKAWIEEVAAMCRPEKIEICDGSQEEYDRLCDLMVKSGTFSKLDDAKAPQQLYLLLRSRRRGPR